MILKALAAFGALMIAPMALASEPRHGDVVDVEAKYLFVPNGFDDNDEIVAVVDGFLPSGCYKLTTPSLTIDPASKKIAITPRARYFDVTCIEALVPYNIEVSLGRLPHGEFDVRVASNGLEETLLVDESLNAGPDDFLYAPVDSVSVDKIDGAYVASLKVRQLAGLCMEPAEIKVMGSRNTVEIMPVIKTDNSPTCHNLSDDTLTWTVKLPELAHGRKLLHVRSLSGKSINHVFSVSPY